MIAKYNLTLDEDMLYLIETLKVEGYWSTKNYTLTLQNKNIPLLNHIEEVLKNRGLIIPSKRVLLKIQLPDETKKEDVKIVEENKELSFHMEISPFDNKKVKAVTSLPYKKEYQLELIHKNEKIPIKIKWLDKEIIYESKLKCFIYGDLRFAKIELLKFLDKHCGEKKYFHIEEILLNADERKIISALSALIDCEGTITWYGLKRNIQIRMRNKKYLEQWQGLLKKWNIICRFEKDKDGWGIVLEGWEDFNKLQKMGLKLYHSEKAKKFEEIMLGFKRKQISRGSYKQFYVNKLKEINKKISIKEFSKIIGKSERNTAHHIRKLKKDELVSIDKNQWPHLYFIKTSSVR
jgi:DNA-binding transcriptional ArsR family regulator